MKSSSIVSYTKELLDIELEVEVKDIKVDPNVLLYAIDEEVSARKAADSLRYCVTWDDPMSMY